MSNAIDTTAKLHHATRAKAEKLATLLAAEYPLLTLQPIHNEDGSKVTGWAVVHTATTGEDDGNEAVTVLIESDKVPDLADIFDACDEHGIDPEDGADEEEAIGGSIVPEEYRAMYREASSNGQTCGDWLAEWLVNQTHSANGFDVEHFSAILHTNKVDMTKPWAALYQSGQKGWIGRYRMNGRQVLEKLVAMRGKVLGANGEQYALPADDLAILRGKHAKWLAKEEKKLAKAEAEAA